MKKLPVVSLYSVLPCYSYQINRVLGMAVSDDWDIEMSIKYISFAYDYRSYVLTWKVHSIWHIWYISNYLINIYHELKSRGSTAVQSCLAHCFIIVSSILISTLVTFHRIVEPPHIRAWFRRTCMWQWKSQRWSSQLAWCRSAGCRW